VTLIDSAFAGLRWREVPVYIVAQVSGAIVGVIVANLMFSLEAVTFSTRERWSGGTGLGEIVATLGLLLVVFGISRRGTQAAVPFAVGAYITGAYFFTSSTSFANPAVTIGRMLSNTFAGISPASVGPFIAAQLAGAAVAWLLIRWLFLDLRDRARRVVVPHPLTGDDPG
jgi:glycerol uptake facilitator-like aquaporin